MTVSAPASAAPVGEPVSPLIRWHGSKWMLAEWIISHMPKHRRYVEPFAGAGSVLMRKARSHSEIISDLDDDLVNLFHMARDHGPELRFALEMTPYARAEYQLCYKPATDPMERARRTVIRSAFGHGSNGHARRTSRFRHSSNDSGTAAAMVWKNYPAALDAIIARLQGVTIENRPALELFPMLDSADTLFYLDPPYVKSTRTGGRDYRHEMTDDDHVALAEAAHKLEGMVILSGYRSQLYGRLFKGWHREEKAALADGSRERVECLWFNDAAWARHPSPALEFNEIASE